MANHRRGPWSNAEDRTLLLLVSQQGPNNWVRISNAIGTRSPKQCRERFHQNLKPTLNHEPITEEEGREIERMVAEMGKRWAEIARRLRGRSDNAVKNWWNGGMNRRRRDVRKVSGHEPAMGAHVAQQSSLTGHHQHYLPPEHGMYHQHHPYGYLPAPQHHLYQRVPRPLALHPTHAAMPYAQRRSYDTPLPSPSALSVMSAEGAPSLISDTSTTRSPHTVLSPVVDLPPLIGSRSERRNSEHVILHLGQNHPATDEDDQSNSYPAYSRSEEQKREFYPPPQPYGDQPSTPYFREPLYSHGSQRPAPLLVEPLHSTHRQHSYRPATPAPASRQVQLPAIRTLAHPVGAPSLRAPSSPGLNRPAVAPLTSPIRDDRSETETSRTEQSLSPSSANRDARMSFSTMLS